MNREEAIEAIKCNWPDSRYTILREALDMAISALRQQETVTKCNDLFDEDGGEILNDEAVADRHQMTNAQKIRAMSDEELAKLLCCTGWRMIEQKECLEWLQQPAEEDDHE